MHEVATVEVALDGASHQLVAEPGQILLDVIEAAGLAPPYSCRAGCCAACMALLVEGQVEMISNSVLNEDDLAQGWVLVCQSIACSPKLKLQYPE